jgi:ATP-dependent DNA ligase
LPRIGVGGAGPQWLHEIKFDGYRMHSPLDRGAVRLLNPHRTRLEA